MKRHFSLFLAAAALCALAACAARPQTDDIPELGGKPKTGVWYRVTPPGTLTCKGLKWNGFFRKGSENKVMVYFCGGGVSVDEYMAARADSYYTDELGEGNGKDIPAMLDRFLTNPDSTGNFKDWTILLLPYVTADFHCGTAVRPYVNLKGQQDTLYYNGYNNFKKFMDAVAPVVDTPDALLITGSSAGGFGTAIMSDDVIGYFPDTKNVTSLVDAGLLLSDNWHKIAQDEWKAPEHIVSRLTSDNMVLDCLKALHQARPYVKILFGVSQRDGILVEYQNYLNVGDGTAFTEADGIAFQEIIKNMVLGLQESIPDVGINIWDDGQVDDLGLTTHTIELRPSVLTDFTGNGSYMDWMMDAVDGNVRSFGLDRLGL